MIGCPGESFPGMFDRFFSPPATWPVHLFGLPIYDRIESPTAAVIMRLYSNLGVDFTPARLHQSRYAGYRG